ncbi:retinitis pigmentosa 9 protein-like isoform X1 [Leptotrombidium deliense]|uniref:Retinitis pigmentosa 9 protein-like isoform X1 n=1 Tax=Leptotrombidium deliense TaxID=299467 RepID=A0A443SS69_9ACAR|nr:retinitis pigmentosa 9 protein-like isoform X1 [Leptotrombidium deliense]
MSRESKKDDRDDSDAEQSSASIALHPKRDKALIKALKHIDAFYEKAPPGFVKEPEERPEDSIPDLPENKAAREFLAKAPTKGLWMPLGKEVKVMQCWRCKAFGHRTGDKECPLFISGNQEIEKFRYLHEDPMYSYIMENKFREKQEKVRQLQALLDETSSESSSSNYTEEQRMSADSCHKRKHKHSKKRHKKEKTKKQKHKTK